MSRALPRRVWAQHVVAELAYIAWRMEWDAGRFWCRHSYEAGEWLHEAFSAECGAGSSKKNP